MEETTKCITLPLLPQSVKCEYIDCGNEQYAVAH